VTAYLRPATLDEALEVSARISGLFSELMERVPDRSFHAMRGLQEAMLGSIPPPGQQLPRIARITPAAATTSLVLAYEQDGHVADELALVERNAHIRHPGFVPGGRPVEVLIRA